MTKSDELFEYALQNLVAMLRVCKDLGMGADVRGVMTAARLVRDGAKLGIPDPATLQPEKPLSALYN